LPSDDFSLRHGTDVFIVEHGVVKTVGSWDDNLTTARLVSLDGGRTAQLAMNLHYGGQSGLSECVVLYGEAFQHSSSVHTVSTALDVGDVDEDGCDELILHTDSFVSFCNAARVNWPDVFRWTSQGLEKWSQKCGKFYATAVFSECIEELRFLHAQWADRDEAGAVEQDVLKKIVLVTRLASGIASFGQRGLKAARVLDQG
jgi:hypothetical protein